MGPCEACRRWRSHLPPLLLLMLFRLAAASDVPAAAQFAFSVGSFRGDGGEDDFISLGDAQMVPDHSSPNSSVAVQLSGSQKRTVGRFLWKKPVPLQTEEEYGTTFASFSTAFSFSLVRERLRRGRERERVGAPGDGFAFVLVPDNVSLDWGSLGMVSLDEMQEAAAGWVHRRSAPQVFAVEFDSFWNPEFLDPNDNHIGVDIESLVSVATANASDVGVRLAGGERLLAWIDYDAFRKLLEVRLGMDGSPRPAAPLLSLDLDLRSLVNHNMFVGFSSSAGDNPLKHLIHSWCFGSGRGEEGYPFKLCDFDAHDKNNNNNTAVTDEHQAMEEPDDDLDEHDPATITPYHQDNPTYRHPSPPSPQQDQENPSPNKDEDVQSWPDPAQDHPGVLVPGDASQEKRAKESSIIEQQEQQQQEPGTQSSGTKHGRLIVGVFGSMCLALLSLLGFVAWGAYNRHHTRRGRQSPSPDMFRQPTRYGYQELISSSTPPLP